MNDAAGHKPDQGAAPGVPENANQATIAITRLGKYYGSLQVLLGVNFYFGEREVVTVTCLSGCGNIILWRCIDMLLPVNEGAISVDGEEISQPREGISIVSNFSGCCSSFPSTGFCTGISPGTGAKAGACNRAAA